MNPWCNTSTILLLIKATPEILARVFDHSRTFLGALIGGHASALNRRSELDPEDSAYLLYLANSFQGTVQSITALLLDEIVVSDSDLD